MKIVIADHLQSAMFTKLIHCRPSGHINVITIGMAQERTTHTGIACQYIYVYTVSL